MRAEAAETIALEVLSWLIGNDDLRPVFLGATGAGEADLRARADEPEFLASVLDFLCMDDAWVIAFCDANSAPYSAPLEARRALPGGDEVSWT